MGWGWDVVEWVGIVRGCVERWASWDERRFWDGRMGSMMTTMMMRGRRSFKLTKNEVQEHRSIRLLNSIAWSSKQWFVFVRNGGLSISCAERRRRLW